VNIANHHIYIQDRSDEVMDEWVTTMIQFDTARADTAMAHMG